ncbi:MAG: 3-isopropylmalate dehydratase [Deltaproteobacteria bacterium]|nr:3-isopropylmalate dehydratase [Deltaproteobacteria bacterium]
MTVPRRKFVRVSGRVLWLTRDPAALARQLAGEDLDRIPDADDLIDNISTDELTPGWVCYYYDQTLARYCLVGLRGGLIGAGAVRRGGFGAIASGRSKGCGSSRETAPYAEREAGVQLVVARSIEKIYGQNCHNIGLVTTTDFGILERARRGAEIPIAELTRGLDRISADVVEYGGLFAYNRARLAGEVAPPPIETAPRAMTLAEKIAARHVIVDAKADRVGVAAVGPGDSAFVRTDLRFSHEYVTAMAEALFTEALGPAARVSEPESVFCFRDHLTFLDQVMSEEHVRLGLREQAAKLEAVQREFARSQGIKLFGEVERDGRPAGSEAICHNKVIEELALPGQVVVGTDSHTCMAGAIGCLAFGVGSTDMANAWLTRDVRLAVPESVRVLLKGRLGADVAAKDVMLYLLALPYWKSGQGIGKVIEFSGPAVAALSLDERATLTNMAVEAGGFTGIVEADEVVAGYLAAERGLDPAAVRARIVKADPGARYAHEVEIDLGALEPMVATPGDPRNGIPLSLLEQSRGGEVRIDIAYGGSCTGGKKADMDMYATVLGRAVRQSRTVAPGVELYIQFGSQQIRRYAESKGYIELFRRAGAKLVEPSCGACIKAGPGSSTRPDQVTVSAINRNFPGRSGPGQIYLASPLVVAASAIAGKIAAPNSVP